MSVLSSRVSSPCWSWRMAFRVLLTLVSFGLTGCHPETASHDTVGAPAIVAPANVSGIAAGTSPVAASPARETPVFDGDNAFAYLKKQCDFGPRPLGSAAHDKLRDYLIAEMKKYAD